MKKKFSAVGDSTSSPSSTSSTIKIKEEMKIKKKEDIPSLLDD